MYRYPMSPGRVSIAAFALVVMPVCAAAGGHHDPGPFGQSRPDSATHRITLSPGRLGIFDGNGSSLIVHTNADTYCNAESDLKQGCAGGAREACGIIKPAP